MADRRRIGLTRSGVMMKTLSSQQGARKWQPFPDKYLDLLQHKKAFANSFSPHGPAAFEFEREL